MSQANPPVHNPEVLEFLLTRRSHPPVNLTAPAPDAEALSTMLRAAMRVPDHGKLEPWRFVVAEGPALERLATLIEASAQRLGLDPDKTAKGIRAFRETPMLVAVIGCPKESDKVPAWEQELSAGAACLSLVNAALASGYGACWLTGWTATDATFAQEGLGTAPGEWIAGLIHIGTARGPSPERPRPEPEALITYL